MALGYLGDIQFNVSSKQVLTFKDLNHSSSAKFHDHEIIGQKPLSEFLGCDLDKITMSIELNSSLGINIKSQIEKITKYEQAGTPLDFVLGSEPFGQDKWVIESTGRAYDIIYSNGACTSLKIDLNLREYISDKNLQPNKKKNTSFYKSVENVDKSSLILSYTKAGTTSAMNPVLNTITC